MRLAELDPHWLVGDGKRLGLVFKCPHCKLDASASGHGMAGCAPAR